MDISVIIVNYNTTAHLKNCINSIIKYSKGIEFEIIIVDNNSEERDIEIFPTIYPQINFIFSNVNLGFGAGCNSCAKIAKGRYFCFINPDIVVRNNVIYELFKIMENDETIGVSSPVYIEEDGNISYTYNYFPSYKWEFLESLGVGVEKEINRLTNVKEIINKMNFEVDWLMGSFLFARSDAFNKVSDFDERIFLYYEDVDLQYRIKKSGYKILCCPQLRVSHFKRSSIRTYEGENIYYFHMTRSHMIFLYKHYRFIKRNTIRFMRVIGICVRALLLLFRRKFKGKKRKKIIQYRFMLKIYLSGFKSILSSKYPESPNYDIVNSGKQLDVTWN